MIRGKIKNGAIGAPRLCVPPRLGLKNGTHGAAGRSTRHVSRVPMPTPDRRVEALRR